MSMDAITPPTSATSVPDAANVVDDSSDDEEQSYNLEEGILDFYVGKAKFTVANYSNRIKQFRNWYRELYGRELDSKPCLKIKHVRLFFQEKSKTCRQMRALVVVIKGLLRHLYKIKVLKKDLSLTFKTEKQLPPAVERVMSPELVKRFFIEANKHRNSSTTHMLQCLAYGGVRRTACSELMKTDIKKIDHQKNGELVSNFSIFVRNGKGMSIALLASILLPSLTLLFFSFLGGKSRTIALKKSIGASLYHYAQGLNSQYLFPGAKPGTHLCAQQIANRVKKMAIAIGEPQVSCHFFRREYNSFLLQSLFRH
jgi:site-specific recombinase XerD